MVDTLVTALTLFVENVKNIFQIDVHVLMNIHVKF